MRGAAWLGRLSAQSMRHDLLHVHSGSVLRHSRLVPKRFVLHLHGTDIRTLQYDPSWTAVVRAGVASARAVFYSTPDLAEHVLPLRPDATLLPVPVDVGRLPLAARGGPTLRVLRLTVGGQQGDRHPAGRGRADRPGRGKRHSP